MINRQIQKIYIIIVLVVPVTSQAYDGFSLLNISVKPESVKPESVKPESVKPESVKPESVKPESVKPESVKLNFSLMDTPQYRIIESDSGHKTIVIPPSDFGFETSTFNVPSFDEIDQKSIKLVDLDKYPYKSAWDKRQIDKKPLILFLSGSLNQNSKINKTIANLMFFDADEYFNIATADSKQQIFKMVAPINCDIGIFVWADGEYKYFGVDDFDIAANAMLKFCVTNQNIDKKAAMNWPKLNKN